MKRGLEGLCEVLNSGSEGYQVRKELSAVKVEFKDIQSLVKTALNAQRSEEKAAALYVLLNAAKNNSVAEQIRFFVGANI